MKKIYILLGHPDKETFSGALADAYEAGAREAGHEVRRTNLGELSFDPILHKGYKEIQELEPDLIQVQEDMKWAEHVVVIYPNWWNTMPALLKGMFDRMFLPGFAFNFDKVKKKLIQRLTGRTARVVIVAGTHNPFWIWFKFGDYTNEIRRGILKFAGFSPVRLSTFGPCEKVNDRQKKKWKDEIFELGRKGV